MGWLGERVQGLIFNEEAAEAFCRNDALPDSVLLVVGRRSQPV